MHGPGRGQHDRLGRVHVAGVAGALRLERGDRLAADDRRGAVPERFVYARLAQARRAPALAGYPGGRSAEPASWSPGPTGSRCGSATRRSRSACVSYLSVFAPAIAQVPGLHALITVALVWG
ncbi:hypothetical protein ACRAWD_01805 [Caulobacter segnis]